jgi:hypothetical protein
MPAGKARMMRVSHDYHRGGALAYLAAYDVHWAKIYGRWEATTGIETFTALVTQVMTQEPYASADRVFWVVDNGVPGGVVGKDVRAVGVLVGYLACCLESARRLLH